MTMSVGMIFPTIAQNVPAYVPTNGLVGWWPFNGNANDESGNGNHGTVKGAMLTSDRTGNANSAYNFDGLSNWIQVLDNISLQLGNMTMSLWIKTTSTSSKYLLFKQNISDASNENYGFEINPLGENTIYFGGKYGDCSPGNGWEMLTCNLPNLTNNKWHNVVGTISEDSIRFYFDGFKYASLKTSKPSMTICSGGSNLMFGRGWDSYPKWYLGHLDDIAIYNRALTEKEIKQLYQEGKDSIKYIDKDNRIETIKTITLPNVQFFTNSDQLLSSSRQDLDGLAKYLFENPNSNAEIIGHTDNVGDFQKNMKLSLDRANSVKKYLKEKGIDAIRINAIGKGPTEPKESNDTPEGRLMNRRVEVKISQQTRN